MAHKLFWLAFKAGGDYKLSPFWADSGEHALLHDIENVLDQELVAVFTGELGFTQQQMLKLPPPGSPMLRPRDRHY